MNGNYQPNVQQVTPPAYQNPPPAYGYPQVNLNVQNSVAPQGYSKTVTIMDWFIFMLLQSIPLVNLIALFFYAFDKEKPSRANFARLTLIFMIIILVLAILTGIIIAICGITLGTMAK